MTTENPVRGKFSGSLEDYDAVASAVMETERGRWFLEEFARRNRAADTGAVLEALSAMERRLADGRAGARTAPAVSTEAVELLERASGRVALLRRELNETTGTNRHVVRALRLSTELQNILSSALTAIGSPSTTLAASETITPLVEAPEARRIQTSASPQDDADALRRTIESAAPGGAGGALRNGEAVPIAAADAAEIETPARAPSETQAETSAPPAPKPSRPGGLPSAWTPGLLENLSEEDRAALFA